VTGVTWEMGADGIAEIRFETPGEKVNLLDTRALAALEEACAFLEGQESLAGVIVLSRKPRVFIAGADVKLIAAVVKEEEGRDGAMAGQRVFGRLERLKVPTVAAVAGTCLGGGLELSLACTYRVAADAEEVQMGLPEVKLGLIPGWGGTQRLPRLIGLPAALDMILTGRTHAAIRARKLGLVDSVVPPERIFAEARRLILKNAGRRRLPGLQRVLLSQPARSFVLSRAAAAVRRSTGGHYPAPPAAIDAIRTGLARGMEEGLRREAEHLGRLVVGEASRNLVRIFLASRGSDEEGGGREIREVGILGAGVMGASIAGLAASRGFGVRLRDLASDPLSRGLGKAAGVIKARGRHRKAGWVESHLLKIRPTTTLVGFGNADLLLEAVVEDLAVKERTLSEAESRVKESCILATNTSSLPVDRIAAALRRPERFVGLHFFNPAEKMPLVEVVRGDRSSAEAVETARSFARRLGKTPVVVGDAAGFVVNRLLMPYLSEALCALIDGGEIASIDRAMKRFGMPMGPLALLDQIGIDVAAKVAGVLEAAFGPPGAADSGASRRLLEALAEAGRLGVKSGRGFYTHKGKEHRPDPEAATMARALAEDGGPPGDALVERLLYPMINEAARVLDEKVAANPATVDVAMVFGTGFPPFLGGPLRWADSLGVAKIAGDLDRLAAAHGQRLAPSEPLRKIAADPGRFHTA
jgi:3-hydroxyacyl-CoA dehydrogenase/enoyl-CoA hydratase/3-hydroxybutyryl-CoA epimerase